MNKPLAKRTSAFASDPTNWRPDSADEPLLRVAEGSLFCYPQLRWSFNHARRLGPTKTVGRGEGPTAPLPCKTQDLLSLKFTTPDGQELTLAESLTRTCADGFIVLHRGRTIHESYSGEGAGHRSHICMSVTKSVVGTIAAMLVSEGALDPDALVPHYAPELSQGAYRDASVRHVLDMLIGVAYREDYDNTEAEIWDYARAGALFPRGPAYSGPRDFRTYLTGLGKQGEHGQAFDYKTINTEVLGWILKNVT